MTLSCRTVFISDIHLGTRGCQAELLLDFIKTIDCETLYLVGDIVDGWKLKTGWRWPQAHSDVVQKVLRLARRGVQVIYVPGNHDDRLRDFCGVHFGGVLVARDAIHVAADGKRYLVTHGDEFDGIVSKAKWLAHLGDYSYRALLTLNTRWNGLRRRLGLGYWSLSAFVKLKVKNALQFIDDFERAVAEEARRRGVDGVICGHIHHAEMREIDGILYVNDGDWVESCTAVVEHHDGRLEVLDWAKARGWSMVERNARKPAAAPEPLCAAARLCLTRLKTERPRNSREAALDAGFIVNTFPINRHSRASIGVALLALLLVAACSTPPGPPTLLSAPPSPVAPSIPAPTPAAPASLACDGPADFAAAARFNAAAETSLLVAPFGRNEMGWGAYGPLAAATLQTPCASDSPGFAKALAVWEGAHGLVASGALDAAALQTFKGIWQERRPFVMLRLADVCPPPPADADLETLAPQETADGDKPVQLRKTTAAALRRMVAAARAEEPALTADPLLLTVFSGYRSPAYDAARCASENNCQGLVRASCSAHCTGLAVDLDVGSEPGFPLDASVDSNRLAQTNGPAYRWLVRNAGRFGFVNYAFEPWHWEWTGEAP